MQNQKSRLVAHAPSSIQTNILGDSDTEAAVLTLLQIFESCLGPRGRCKLLHNGLGGHVTVTSSSTRLFQSLHLSNPILTLISATIQRHLTLFSDCGSMAMTLALYVIKDSLTLDVPRHLTTEVLTLCAQECIGYLNSDSCNSKVTVSLDNLKDMLRLVRGITSTKPGCCTSTKDMEHINRCVIELFLKSFDVGKSVLMSTKADPVLYTTVEGAPIRNSHILEGMLVDACHIPTYKKQPLSARVLQGGLHAGQIGVAIFNVSMSGDTDNYMDVIFESSSASILEKGAQEQIMQLTAELCKRGVGAIMCQKVIHPRVKQFVRRQGVLVLDRLGFVQIGALHHIAGGQFFSSFQKPVDEADFGYLQEISHKIINNKSYVHVVGTDESAHVYTMVLCGPSEESLAELKHVCSVGQHVLRQVMSTSRHALTGCGLWQRDLAAHLNELPNVKIDEWSQSLECSRLQIRTVFKTVADSLVRIYSIVSGVPVMDIGLEDSYVDVRRTCVVLDAFIPAIEAVSSALFASSMVLGINYYISG